MSTVEQPYRVGDIVRMTGKFLRSVAWYTNVPVNGEVQEIHLGLDKKPDHQVLTVEWSDGHRGNILSSNGEFCPKGRKLTIERRRSSER